ncbi:hypothetical protein AMTRI_Chr12g236560 [Amborella trichopoda]
MNNTDWPLYSPLLPAFATAPPAITITRRTGGPCSTPGSNYFYKQLGLASTTITTSMMMVLHLLFQLDSSCRILAPRPNPSSSTCQLYFNSLTLINDHEYIYELSYSFLPTNRLYL